MDRKNDSARPVVICVDDEPGVLASLRRALRQEPYELLMTGNAREALEWVATRDVHVVVTDHRMPEISGAELLAIVEERAPGTEGVLLTAYPGAPPVAERVARGRARLIAKPWIDAELRRTIRDLLERGVRRREHQAEAVTAWIPFDIAEPLIRVDCRGERTARLLREIGRLLAERAPSVKAAAFLLEDLQLLEDPPTGFLRSLLDRLIPWNISVSLIDRSGLAGNLVDTLDTCGAIALYGPEVLTSRAKKVLVVEDDPETLGYLCALVRGAGHAAEGGRFVSEVLSRLPTGRIDLAILDLGIPEGGAIALSQKLLQKDSRIDLVALSRPQDPWDDEICDRLGFWRRLEKPCRVAALLGALQEGGLRRESG